MSIKINSIKVMSEKIDSLKINRGIKLIVGYFE